MTTTSNDALTSTTDRKVVIEKLQNISPDFVELISGFCLDKIYDRPVLSEHIKETVAISSLISLGCLDRLNGHFESALESGMSKTELTEIVLLTSIYVGFPRAIDAMLVLHEMDNKQQ